MNKRGAEDYFCLVTFFQNDDDISNVKVIASIREILKLRDLVITPLLAFALNVTILNANRFRMYCSLQMDSITQETLVLY